MTMNLIAIVFVKYAAYWLVCRLAPRILALQVIDVSAFAFKWASVRLGIGLLTGVFMFFGFWAFNNKHVNVVVGYVLTFGLMRCLEWMAMYLLIMRSQGQRRSLRDKKALTWIAIGVCCNVTMDLVIANSNLLKGLRFVC